MPAYITVIGTIAGICLGYAILYFFVGLRRGEDKWLKAAVIVMPYQLVQIDLGLDDHSHMIDVEQMISVHMAKQ